MKLSKLAVSFLLFIVFYLLLLKTYPRLFEESDQEKCCMLFFIIGLCAIIAYNIVDSLYK
jgi:divalent metal cation (Fe/Co/Zn/Cd) transporter